MLIGNMPKRHRLDGMLWDCLKMQHLIQQGLERSRQFYLAYPDPYGGYPKPTRDDMDWFNHLMKGWRDPSVGAAIR